MRKMMVLLAFLLFTCGCSAHYELTIDENFEEVTSVYSNPNSNETYQGVLVSDYLNSYLKSNIPAFYDEKDGVDIGIEKLEGVNYYTISPYQKNGNEGFISSYSFGHFNFYRSSMIKECFDEVSVQKNDTVYRINTGMGCKAYQNYPSLSDLTIELITNYDVISSNADEVKNGHYYWYFNQSNYDSKHISFVFNTASIDLSDFDSYMEKQNSIEHKLSEYANDHKVLIILAAFGLFVVILAILIIIKNHKK